MKDGYSGGHIGDDVERRIGRNGSTHREYSQSRIPMVMAPNSSEVIVPSITPRSPEQFRLHLSLSSVGLLGALRSN